MNELPLWATIPATVLLIASGLITLIGALGLLRFNRFYSRMHAMALCNTMGVGTVLFASMLVSSAVERVPVIHELVIMLFLVLVSPISAILLMRAGVRRDARRPVADD